MLEDALPMNCTFPTVSSTPAISHNQTLIKFPPFKSRSHRAHLNSKTLIFCQTNFTTRLGYSTHNTRRRSLVILCCTAAKDGGGRKWSIGNWKKWFPIARNFGPDSVLRSITGATSSPICQFISSPTTFLHSVDPRVKLVWLLSLIFLPARSHIYIRSGIVFYLALLSISVLPRDVWKDQLGRVSFLSGILFIMVALSTDGLPIIVSPRTPPSSLLDLPDISKSYVGYKYLVFKLGPLRLTKRGLSVGFTSACLTFTIFQSASLCLATTTPEQLASALRWFLRPLASVGVPVSEVILTLLLSLRFINLVFDEVRNVALGILSRRISWKHLTPLETIEVFVMFIRRIFKNIFIHAEQISQAMIVRGFRGESESHKIHIFAGANGDDDGFRIQDVVSLLALVGLAVAALASDRWLV